jgi:hypothetical protein
MFVYLCMTTVFLYDGGVDDERRAMATNGGG